MAKILTLIDECLDNFEKFFIGKIPLATVSAVTTLKGKNLALGCLSLALDGLGQEAGALFRPLLETIELLRYIRVHPDGVSEGVEGRLPKAGKISAKIDGRFKELRDYLNANAAHMSVSYDAMHHLISLETGKIQKVQPHRPDALKTNLAQLFTFMSILATETAATLKECGKQTGIAPVSTESLVRKIHEFQTETSRMFSLEKT